jgi:hypothetical protein
MAVARPRRAWQTRELWVGAAVLVVAVVAIALRAGTGKLALSPSELRAAFRPPARLPRAAGRAQRETSSSACSTGSALR